MENSNVIDFVKLLPENFKISRGNNKETDLEKYELNPLLLTAHLLNITTNNQYEHNLDDVRREFRMQDTLYEKALLYQPEIYKGYNSFRSTNLDLVYFMRTIGLDIEVEELCPSGLIDDDDIAKIDGTWLINNEDMYIRNSIYQPQYTGKHCMIGIKAIIEIIDDGQGIIENVSLVYNKLVQLLLNRLYVLVVLGPMTFEFNIISEYLDELDEKFQASMTLEQIEEELFNDVYINNANPEIIDNSETPGNIWYIDGYRLSEVFNINYNLNIKEIRNNNLINNDVPATINHDFYFDDNKSYEVFDWEPVSSNYIDNVNPKIIDNSMLEGFTWYLDTFKKL